MKSLPCAEISTGNITAADNELLSGHPTPGGVICDVKDGGFWVYIPDPDDLEESLDMMSEAGFSSALTSILRNACYEGYFYLHITCDCDTNENPDLPSFDW